MNINKINIIYKAYHNEIKSFSKILVENNIKNYEFLINGKND